MDTAETVDWTSHDLFRYGGEISSFFPSSFRVDKRYILPQLIRQRNCARNANNVLVSDVNQLGCKINHAYYINKLSCKINHAYEE